MIEELPKEWHQLFETELLQEIKENGKIRQLKEGEKLLESGKNIRFFPIVISGTLNVTRTDESGRELLLYYLGKNDSCAMTFSCCMQTAQSKVSIAAEEEAEVLVVPTHKLSEWIQKYNSWKVFTMNTIQGRFNELLNTLDQVVFQNLDTRLIAYLRNKSTATGSKVITLSHQ